MSHLLFQVMQIFFPVTLQLHPKEFPGEHPNDCPRDVKKPEYVFSVYVINLTRW